MPASTPNPNGQASASAATEIAVEGLFRSFGENHVLRGVDLRIMRGELVAIVGGSGSGKSVLLHHITGHFLPDAGKVRIADHDAPGSPLRDLSTLDEEGLDHIRLHWSVVFQRNALFSGTVLENIAFWLRENRGMNDAAIRTIAIDALGRVGFKEPAKVLDRDRDALSGGMAKRVAIARAIAMDPMLYFYDEPTTGLDPSLAAQIHELVFDSHQTPANDGGPRTTVIITHDKDLLQRLRPRVVMLHEGQVYFDSTYDEFCSAASEIIRPYFAMMPALQTIPRQS